MVESFIFFNYNELSILYTGFKLFILSEFLIFLSLFASYFNYMLLSVSMSSLSLFVIFFSIPFSNLLILLYSSFSIQSSLIFIKFGYLYNVIEGISQTISIGILFLVLQFKEFLFSIYSYSSSFLGSLLYFTTGLHGLHVIIGLLFLLFSFFTLFLSYLTSHTLIHLSFCCSSHQFKVLSSFTNFFSGHCMTSRWLLNIGVHSLLLLIIFISASHLRVLPVNYFHSFSYSKRCSILAPILYFLLLHSSITYRFLMAVLWCLHFTYSSCLHGQLYFSVFLITSTLAISFFFISSCVPFFQCYYLISA